MLRIAFKMKLIPGNEEEYQRRHDTLWPELAELLKKSGIEDYSIFLDRHSSDLFGYLKIENASNLDQLPQYPVMQKWWTYMKDIMETNEDHSPVTIPMKEVFFMP
jgi:L-rhamnose mutarotase